MRREVRESDAELVARILEDVFQRATEEVLHDDLTALVLAKVNGELGRSWKYETADRRVRDALTLMLEGDRPVISAGHGFKLATRATEAERERACDLIQRQIEKLSHKQRRIRAVTLAGDSVLGELFAPGHPGIEWRP